MDINTRFEDPSQPTIGPVTCTQDELVVYSEKVEGFGFGFRTLTEWEIDLPDIPCRAPCSVTRRCPLLLPSLSSTDVDSARWTGLLPIQ